LLAALPWLCQGDVFELLPQLVADLSADRQVRASIDVGPALLVTNGCDLDKPNGRRDAQPRIERLQFLPIRDLRQQEENRQRMARSAELLPPEVVYVAPEVAGVGEGFCLLSEMYSLPAGYFDPRLREFEHPEAEPGKAHLEATAHGNRLGRLGTAEVDLLQSKMVAFWPRRIAEDESTTR
jgi:hypothetical protein